MMVLDPATRTNTEIPQARENTATHEPREGKSASRNKSEEHPLEVVPEKGGTVESELRTVSMVMEWSGAELNVPERAKKSA